MLAFWKYGPINDAVMQSRKYEFQFFIIYDMLYIICANLNYNQGVRLSLVLLIDIGLSKLKK